MANKTSKVAAKKAMGLIGGKFEADPNIPRFVKLVDDRVMFRNPITGRNEKGTVEFFAENIEEFAAHPYYNNMTAELKRIIWPDCV